MDADNLLVGAVGKLLILWFDSLLKPIGEELETV
jgi:hypothetical protein